VEHWIATIGFGYGQPPTKFTERVKNPLGFEVRSYRRDQEVVQAGS
jgi:type IV secretion system protein VirB8